MNKANPSAQLASLRLARTHGVGPITYRRLLERFGSAQSALDALPQLAKNGGRKTPLTPFCTSSAEAELDKLHRLNATLLTYGEQNYPPLLAQIEDAPCVLSVLGDPKILHRPQIAIVGSRNASLPGRKITENIAQSLGKSGYVITSGLARGIDTSAHQAALPSGTIAVLAGGIDYPYPDENTNLYHQIAEQGALVAENAFGTQPTNMHFPRRNRIISGLSLGTLIVEAALKSGSLITASTAADQGRDVFAIPGHPFDPRAAGPNALIRDGATLVSRADDIINALTTLKHIVREIPPEQYSPPPLEIDDNTLNHARSEITSLLSSMRVSVDELITQTQIPAPILHTVLLELELAGRLLRHPANYVSTCFHDESVDKPATLI